MKKPYQQSGTVQKYFNYLNDLYEVSRVENTFDLNLISVKNNVTRVIGTVVKRKGILASHPTIKSTYKWTAAKPTMTMAQKIVEGVNEYNRNCTRERKKKQSQKISMELNPRLIEVEAFFVDNGYSPDLAKKAFEYYSNNNWKDSRGTKVKNWKLKMRSCWMVDWNDRYKLNQNGSEKNPIENKESPNLDNDLTPLIEEREPLFLLKIGRLKISF
jgi:hypothetical protein